MMYGGYAVCMWSLLVALLSLSLSVSVLPFHSNPIRSDYLQVDAQCRAVERRGQNGRYNGEEECGMWCDVHLLGASCEILCGENDV